MFGMEWQYWMKSLDFVGVLRDLMCLGLENLLVLLGDFENLRDCPIKSTDLVGMVMCWGEWKRKVKMLEFVGEFATY